MKGKVFLVKEGRHSIVQTEIKQHSIGTLKVKSEQSGSVHAYYSKQTVNSAMFLDEKANL